MDAVRSNDEDISGYVDLVYTHIFMVNLLRDKKGIIYRAEIDLLFSLRWYKKSQSARNRIGKEVSMKMQYMVGSRTHDMNNASHVIVWQGGGISTGAQDNCI